MEGATVMTTEFHLPAGSSAPGMARATLSALDGPLPDDRDDVLLLTSELVTNAVRHAGSAPLSDVIVRVDADERHVRVEVLNPGASFDPPAPALPSVSGTGLGLFLVDALASDWGVESAGARTKVWFELPNSGTAPHS